MQLSALLLAPVSGLCMLWATLNIWGYLSWKKRYNDLYGKVVLITGASSGIGEALAHEFFRAGCKVILSARSKENLERVKSDLMKLTLPDHIASTIPEIAIMDVADLEAIPKKMEEVISIFGPVDILVNNAGVSFRGSIITTDMSTIQKVMQVNFFGQVAVTKALLPYMEERKSGNILVISSIQGKVAIPYRSPYGASKHALEAFFNSLRAEQTANNIKVTIVCPSYVKTNLSYSALTGSGRPYGALDKTTESGMDAGGVAGRAITAMLQNKSCLLVAPCYYRIVVYLQHFLPNLTAHFMSLRARKGAGNEQKKQN